MKNDVLKSSDEPLHMDRVKVFLAFLAVVAGVIILSHLSAGIWQEKKETAGSEAPLHFATGVTIAEFGRMNALPEEVLIKAWKLKDRAGLGQPVDSLGLSQEEIAARIRGALALKAEHESKNWIKIPLKFALWTAFLLFVFVQMKRRKTSGRRRKILYLSAVALFGVILGADPAPMGTIKDAIALYGARGVVFPPRMIALTVFLLMVVLANKFICAWGCQVGTLQDLIFRLNRNQKDTKGLWRQYRVPFAVSNTVRIVFFILFTAAAFIWAADLIAPIDPFKIYKPAVMGFWGGGFVAALLVASLFVYRPWCQLFCPFGLMGWLLEKISVFKISVNYATCIGCEACSRACPSEVMGAILKQDRTIPDCFACATCLEVCPTASISLAARRDKPPEGKFTEGPSSRV